MKVGVTIGVLGALAIAVSCVPLGETSLLASWAAAGTNQAVMMIAALVIATGTGVVAALRPPLQGWHLVIAMAAFAFVTTKLRPWETLPRFFDQPAAYQLLLAVAMVGTIVSIAAFARPRHARTATA